MPATTAASQAFDCEVEQENFRVLAVDCCSNAIPHLCCHQIDNGKLRCNGGCFAPRKVSGVERCWYSECGDHAEHYWYTCCCCGQPFKNWGQFKKHSRRHTTTKKKKKSHGAENSLPHDNFNDKSPEEDQQGCQLLGKLPNAPPPHDGTAVDAGKVPLLDSHAHKEDQPMAFFDDEEEQEEGVLQLPPRPTKRLMTVLPMEEMPEFQNHASTIYFERDQDGNGPASLVARALTKSEENFKYLQTSDVELGMVLTDLCSRLTRPQKELFAAFLARYQHKIQMDCQQKHAGASSGMTSIDIPTDVPGLRRTIYEGVNSIFRNLPHPPPEWIEDHAYVSIIGCFEDLLAHGHDVDVISDLLANLEMPNNDDDEEDSDNNDAAQARDLHGLPFKVTKLRESLAAARILENCGRRDDSGEVTIATYAIEWNDDYEPNNVKQH